MPIANRNLAAGTRLVANYRKQRFVCTVVAGDGGEGVAYVLEDGSRHKSPSAAGSHVMAGQACNGWRFWSIEGEAPAAAAEGDTVSTEPKKRAERKPRAFNPIKKYRDQSNLEEGQTRWWCAGCLNHFEAPSVPVPTACPQGHTVEGMQDAAAAPDGDAVEAVGD